jgi:pyruvate formate lyase activating enzyme
VYTGNVHDKIGSSTYCPHCKKTIIERDWYQLGAYHVTNNGHCQFCHAPIAGLFDGPKQSFGARRIPIVIF